MPVADETVSTFREFTDELLGVAHNCFTRPIVCSHDNDMGEMAILFSAKQTEHLGTIHTLIDTRHSMDATIVARTMVEGLALLLWARKEPTERARAWRSYSLVFDLETLRERQEAGERFESTIEVDLVTRLRTEGARFLKPGRDPAVVASYERKWHLNSQGKPMRIVEILRDVSDDTFVKLYGDLSHWVHWNSKGVGNGLHREGDTVRISWSDNRSAALSLAAGFQSLLQCLEVLNLDLQLDTANLLKELSSRYIARLGHSGAA